MNNMVRNICSMACIAAAATMAILGADGWGWFLFVAVLIYA